MLHGPGDAEREVQLRVDGHPGGADLPVEAHPARVGHHPGGARARPERGSDVGQQPHHGRPSAPADQSGSAGHDPAEPRPGPPLRARAAASRRSRHHGWSAGQPGESTLTCAVRSSTGSRVPRQARLQRDHAPARRPLPAPTADRRAWSPRPRPAAPDRPCQQRPAQDHGQPRREITAVRRRRQQDHVLARQRRRQRAGQRGRGDRGHLEQPQPAGRCPARRPPCRPRSRDQRRAARLGDGLVCARRQRPSRTTMTARTATSAGHGRHSATATRSPSMTAACARRGATQSPTRCTSNGASAAPATARPRAPAAAHTTQSQAARSDPRSVVQQRELHPPRAPVLPSVAAHHHAVGGLGDSLGRRPHSKVSMSRVMPRSCPTTMPGVTISTAQPRSASSSATLVAWWKPEFVDDEHLPGGAARPSSTSRTSTTRAAARGPPRALRPRTGGDDHDVG